MAKRHMKRGSISLIIREIQIKTTSHWSEWPSSKSLQIINTGEGVEKKGSLLHYWWECKMVQPSWRTVWRFLKKLKIELQYDPAIPLLGIYPEKTIIQKDTCTLEFPACPVVSAPHFHC